ncbi:MAG TPA: glycosyltransferase family 9 protein, partial [Ktedonobacterales bacterium]|nr:glycosyltransferase family 9 protein [Ktedonobacterales bacterium]
AAPRVLRVRPDHLGDVLLSAPALAALRQALPDARLEALVGPWGVDALAHCAALDDVRTLTFPGFARAAKGAVWAPYALLERAAHDLRARQYDAAVILRPDHWWGAALAARAGIPLRIGYALAPGAAALTHTLPVVAREHAVRSSWRLVRATATLLGVGAPIAEDCAPATAHLRWAVAPGERAAARAWLAARDLGVSRAYLVAHPGAGATIKQWSAASWARTLEHVVAARDLAIVLAGAPDEREQLRAIAAALARWCPSHVYISEDGIGNYAALIAGARLMLGVDSGPLHLATAVGTPTVRLYGPSDPAIFGPWGPPAQHLALAADLHCAPCGRLDYARAELPWHPCMALLTPAAVARAALRVVDAASQRPLAVGSERDGWHNA